MRIKKSSGVLVSLLMVAACNKGAENGETKGEPQVDGTDGGGQVECDTASGKIVVGNECQDDPNKVEDKKDDPSLNLQGGTLDVSMVSTGQVALTTALVGQADETQLESLQYRFQSIQICRTMETTGTGYSNPQDCLEIYKGTGDQAEYGNLPPEYNAKNPDGSRKYADLAAYNVAVAAYEVELADRAAKALADTTNYIDLMDPTSVKKLSAQLKLTGKDAHEYNFGLVNWYRPIKVKASIPFIGDTTKVYTKVGTSGTVVTGSDNYLKHVTNSANMTTAPSELAVFEHPNGGSWFRFPTPFVITNADIEAKKDFKLKLTFNPDGIAKAYDNKDSGVIRDTTNDVSIYVPMLHLTPIAHAADKVAQKETYILTRTGVDKFKARVELYTLKDDAAKTVYGVESQSLFTSASTDAMGVSDFPQAFFLEQATGSVTLKDYQQNAFLTMPRLDTKGATATANIVSTCKADDQGMFHPGFTLPEFNCDHEFTETTDVTATFDGVTELK